MRDENVTCLLAKKRKAELVSFFFQPYHVHAIISMKLIRENKVTLRVCAHTKISLKKREIMFLLNIMFISHRLATEDTFGSSHYIRIRQDNNKSLSYYFSSQLAFLSVWWLVGMRL
ncbi:unnamed protein product [Orchesella dallaii]|uniref:Uncharacterized protein n=1 Tax=Orchesella dallaii TaxID=48710 RepID=A0ABP1PU83_9HEXA